MPYLTFKRGNTRPFVDDICINQINGAPVDLSGATVHFTMRMKGKPDPIIDHALAKVLDDDTETYLDSPQDVVTTGKVRYIMTTTDTLTKGEFESEWEVTYDDDSTESFPKGNPAYRDISIQDSLD